MENSKLAILIVAISLASFCGHGFAQNEPPPPSPVPASRPLNQSLHERATADAWAAFRVGENERAITNAEQCIARFREAADRSQTTLEADKVVLPKGNVSEAEKKRIAQYQILHDVGTCFLIKGWAEEKLGRTNEARRAYTEAKKYTHARSSMPAGESFWSPAESASERLAKM